MNFKFSLNVEENERNCDNNWLSKTGNAVEDFGEGIEDSDAASAAIVPY